MEMKKGFLFSLFVITALALIVFTFRSKVEFQEEKRTDVFRQRVETSNIFIEDLDSDIERSLYVAAFRSFLAFDEYMHNTESSIDNVSLRLPELMLNGTYNGENMSSTNSSTFGAWLLTMNSLAKKYNLEIQFNNISIEVGQNSPWSIEVIFSSGINIKDYDNLISWNYTISKSTYIDICDAGFSDPLYYLQSTSHNPENKPLINTITRTPYNSFWNNDTSDTLKSWPDTINASNLISHLNGHYYINSSYGPSYLMRLMGKADCRNALYRDECKRYGIESFVNTSDFRIWEYTPNNEATCAVDYEFFVTGCNSTSDPGDDPTNQRMHRIYGMPDNFYLDWEHMKIYNLTMINRT